MRKKSAVKAPNTRSRMNQSIFMQFMLILLAVICLVLFSSTSFYATMIENQTHYSLIKTAESLSEIDYNSPTLIEELHKIRQNETHYICVYGKADENDENFSKLIFSQYELCVYDDGNRNISKRSPLLNFDYKDFLRNADLDDSDISVGNYVNPKTNNEFCVVAKESDDGENLYVAAVHSSYTDSQISDISLAIILVLISTFLIICVIFYLYVTRITRSIYDILDYTQQMAQSNDPKLAVPISKHVVFSETVKSIKSINHLYQTMLATQEDLKQKNEFLSQRLDERVAEEKVRAEFIASASHELKTPISIIQGFAEGAKLSHDDPTVLDEYCDIIIDECTRMTDLVVNMMSLSKLQHTYNIEYKEFSIREFIEDKLKLQEKNFEKNGITVENLITDDIIGRGDVPNLQFVINNLLSNAISYIGGEKKIRLRYEDIDLSYRIFVFNSGDPIPQKDLEQLWASFYRHDPARNRNDGHFGLGLSIVKSVQDAHSQQCGVDNVEGGVEFWFDILK